MLIIKILRQIMKFKAGISQKLTGPVVAEELDLSQSRISGDDLVKIINHAPKLKKLNLHSCKNLAPLPEILATLNNLEELDLCASNIRDDDLVKIINRAPNLKKLNLHHCKQLNSLFEIIARLNKLEELNLGKSNISGANLAKIINHAPNLKKLQLYRCPHLNPLSEILNKLDKLEELGLSCSNISGDDLSKIINYAPNLKKIDLYNCQHLNPLSEILNKLDKLEELILDGSNISGDDLAKIINHAPNLKKIDLSGCQHLNPLSEILNMLDKLEELGLSCSSISGDDLAKILNHAPNLKKLNLHGCKHLNPLPEILNTLNNLKWLNVTMTDSPGTLIATIAPHAMVNIGYLSPSELIQQNMPLWVKIILAGKYEECAKLLQTQVIDKNDYNLLIAGSYLHHRDTDYPRLPYEMLLDHTYQLSTTGDVSESFITSVKRIIDHCAPLAFGSVRFYLVMQALNQDNKLLKTLNTHQWKLGKNETFKAFLPHYKSWLKDPSLSKIPNSSDFNAKLAATVAHIDLEQEAKCDNKTNFCGNIFQKIFS